MEWFFYLLIAAGLGVLARIYFNVRKLQQQSRTDDWDTRVIERLRAAGSDPFRPHPVNFYFALPTEQACQIVGSRLQADGYEIDTRPMAEGSDHAFSLLASKALRLSVPDMKEIGRRFTTLAAEQGGRYDGWTAGRVPAEGTPIVPLRPSASRSGGGPFRRPPR